MHQALPHADVHGEIDSDVLVQALKRHTPSLAINPNHKLVIVCDGFSCPTQPELSQAVVTPGVILFWASPYTPLPKFRVDLLYALACTPDLEEYLWTHFFHSKWSDYREFRVEFYNLTHMQAKIVIWERLEDIDKRRNCANSRVD